MAFLQTICNLCRRVRENGCNIMPSANVEKQKFWDGNSLLLLNLNILSVFLYLFSTIQFSLPQNFCNFSPSFIVFRVRSFKEQAKHPLKNHTDSSVTFLFLLGEKRPTLFKLVKFQSSKPSPYVSIFLRPLQGCMPLMPGFVNNTGYTL